MRSREIPPVFLQLWRSLVLLFKEKREKCKQGTSGICTLPRDIPQCFYFCFKLMFQSSSVLLFFLLEEPIDPSGVLKRCLNCVKVVR